MTKPAGQATGPVKRYGDLEAVRGISLEVKPGEIHGPFPRRPSLPGTGTRNPILILTVIGQLLLLFTLTAFGVMTAARIKQMQAFTVAIPELQRTE